MSHDLPSKTGLYTSPHLIAVRERIRINSQPLSPQDFAKYFFEVWDKLESVSTTTATPIIKPVYFRFLTLMSYHVFIQENVDCAIYEVGVGGKYDSTNVVEHPAVTGISALGIDHTFTLGNTIEEIAAHKAGIMKYGASAFSIIQPPAAEKVVSQVAAEKNVQLKVLSEDPRLKGIQIHPDAKFQRLNATLAVALSESLLQKINPKFRLDENTLPKEFIDGLEKVVWRGRCEMKVSDNVTWFLDGAHTGDSIDVASNWFTDVSSPEYDQSIIARNR
jgi:folylpolyglutamate synthase